MLKRSGNTSINVCNCSTLCIEICKTLNNINPRFTSEIFTLRVMNIPAQEKYKLNLEISKLNKLRFEIKTFQMHWSKSLELFAIPSEAAVFIEFTLGMGVLL